MNRQRTKNEIRTRTRARERERERERERVPPPPKEKEQNRIQPERKAYPDPQSLLLLYTGFVAGLHCVGPPANIFSQNYSFL